MKISEHIATIYQLAEEIESMSTGCKYGVYSNAKLIQAEVNELDKKLTEIQEFLKSIYEGYGVDYEKLEEILRLF